MRDAATSGRLDSELLVVPVHEPAALVFPTPILIDDGEWITIAASSVRISYGEKKA